MFYGQEAHSLHCPISLPVLPEAMDSARLQMLQELMKEARATGELESSLAATSVMPVPKRPNRKNVPLADFNHAVANMVKPSACVQPSGIQSPGIQAPGIQAVPKSTLLADVPASSNAPPVSQGPMPLPMTAYASDKCADADQASFHSSYKPGNFSGD